MSKKGWTYHFKEKNMTEAGILILSSSNRANDGDMKKLHNLIKDRVLSRAGNTLFADFKSTMYEDFREIMGAADCEHQFGLIDADMGEKFINPDESLKFPINPKIRCIKCKKDYLLFTKDELAPPVKDVMNV